MCVCLIDAQLGAAHDFLHVVVASRLFDRSGWSICTHACFAQLLFFVVQLLAFTVPSSWMGQININVCITFVQTLELPRLYCVVYMLLFSFRQMVGAKTIL